MAITTTTTKTSPFPATPPQPAQQSRARRFYSPILSLPHLRHRPQSHSSLGTLYAQVISVDIFLYVSYMRRDDIPGVQERMDPLTRVYVALGGWRQESVTAPLEPGGLYSRPLGESGMGLLLSMVFFMHELEAGSETLLQGISALYQEDGSFLPLVSRSCWLDVVIETHSVRAGRVYS